MYRYLGERRNLFYRTVMFIHSHIVSKAFLWKFYQVLKCRISHFLEFYRPKSTLYIAFKCQVLATLFLGISYQQAAKKPEYLMHEFYPKFETWKWQKLNSNLKRLV